MSETALRNIFGDIIPVDGFHELESDEFGGFVWSKKCFTLARPPDSDFYTAKMCFNGDVATLSFRTERDRGPSFTVCNGWHTYPLDFSGLSGKLISFELSRVVPVDGDSRELGLMFRRFKRVESRVSLELNSKSAANKALNDIEFREGKVVLTSTPQNIRLTHEDRCNMKPTCVYCNWDRIKLLEEKSGYDGAVGSLSDLGRFYENASSISEASYGEPLLYPDLGNLVAMLDNARKRYELTTNGILLNEKKRRIFLGRNVLLSVSMDAASKEGYARYRNDKFDLVVDNLRRLCKEKKQYRNLPCVIIPFIAMPSNLAEIEPFLDLMKDVGVDLIKLRSLHDDPLLRDRVARRGEYEFRYGDEVLSLEQMREVYFRMAEGARKRNLTVIADIHLEERLAESAPLCGLPWRTMYLVRNGVNLCCFTRTQPLALWHQAGGASIEDYLESVWNGERFQETRSVLADRRLPAVCRDTPACPINRRIQAGL